MKSRVLLSRFAASITRFHCARARTTVEDHGCTGKGRHATRTTTQRFSRPMPLLLLYRAPSFGCSSFFVHRGLCKNRSIDVHGRMQCLHVNLYGPQLLYSSRKFGQVFLTRTVPERLQTKKYAVLTPIFTNNTTVATVTNVIITECMYVLQIHLVYNVRPLHAFLVTKDLLSTAN